MKLSNSMKKFFAYVCAIAMVVSSMTFYGQTSVKAKGSVAVDGKVYTVTDGDATIAGFTCQGIFDKARIHFAWGTEVDAASITTTVDGKSVKIDGTNAHGMFIPLSEVSTLAVGEYQIVVSATATENSATVTGNATLKIEDEGETTTRDPSVKVWIDLGDGFSYDDSTTATVNNIQQPDWSPEKGIYVNVPAGISSVAVNGKTGDEVTKIQGAGVIVFLSAMTEKTNTVEIEYAGGTATVIIKNENGTDDGDTPTVTPTEKPTEAPTVAPTDVPTENPTEAPTADPTQAPTEESTAAPGSEIKLDKEFNEEGTFDLGGYKIYLGTSWNASTAKAGIDEKDAKHVIVQQTNSNWNDAWGLQVIKKFYNLTPNATYTVEWNIVAASNDGNVMVTNNKAKIQLNGGAQTLTGTFTADGEGKGEFVVGMGWVGLTNPIEFFAPVVKDAEGNVLDDSKVDTPNEKPTEAPTETPTEAPTEAPTAAPTEKPTEAPTAAPTEKPTEAPTAAPTEKPTQKPTVAPTAAKVKVGTAKVKSASKKKASAKAKISLKKVKGATKYQVQISTSKNFKKVLVKKTVKKLSFTVKSSKIKNKKKLYVRAKAIKVVGKKSYTGKWSKAKKVKVK